MIEGETIEHDLYYNVEIIKSVFTAAQFQQLFPIANPDMSYENFLKAAAHFPGFCSYANEALSLSVEETCKLALTTLFAHMIRDTNKNDASLLGTTNQTHQGLAVLEHAKCKEDPSTDKCKRFSNKSSKTYKPVDGKSYHWRGTCRLAGSDNYGLLSSYLFGDKTVLLEKPEMVRENPVLSFTCSIFKYMIPKEFQPSVNEIVTGEWTPKGSDKDKGFRLGFGMTTLVLYGKSQCGESEENPNSALRTESFFEIIDMIGASVDPTWLNSCARLGSFDADSPTADRIFFTPDLTSAEPACKLVKKKTPYPCMNEMSYIHCIESIQMVTTDDGLNGGDSTGDSPSGPTGGSSTDPSGTTYNGTVKEEISPEEQERLDMIAAANEKIEVDGDNDFFTIVDDTFKNRVLSTDFKNIYIDTTSKVNMEMMDNEPENVKRFAEAMSETRFDSVFSNRDTSISYELMLNAVKSFPFFCNNACPDAVNQAEDRELFLLEVCKVEVATLFAFMIYNTGNQVQDDDGFQQGLQNLKSTCMENESRKYGEYFNPENDKSYCGRGILKFNSNIEYGMLSQMLFNTQHQLLRVPEKVETDSFLVLLMSMFKYMMPYAPKPSVHEVVTHLVKPTEEDLENGNRTGFGAAMNILYGQEVCGWGRQNSAMTTMTFYYEKLLKKMGRNFYKDEVRECSNAMPYNMHSSTNAFFYFSPDWDSVNEHNAAKYHNETLEEGQEGVPVPGVKCVLKDIPNAFAINLPGSLKRCKEYAMGQDYDPVPEDLKRPDENVTDEEGTNKEDKFKFEINNDEEIVFKDPNVARIYNSGKIIQQSIELDFTTPEKLPENVLRIMKIFNEFDLSTLIKRGNSSLDLNDFLKAAARFPAFCNEVFIEGMSLDDSCKKELATLFAHMGVETRYHEEMDGLKPEELIYFLVRSMECNNSDARQWIRTDDRYPESANANYCPRGTGSIKTNIQYGQFSEAFLGDKDILLENPDLVAQNPVYAFASGLYIYMKRESPTPSCHEVVTGAWTPSEIDEGSSNANDFRTTTNIWTNFTDNYECGYFNDNAKVRGKVYSLAYTLLFKTEPSNEAGSEDEFACPYNTYFHWGGKGTLPEYFDHDWVHQNSCRLVEWITNYKITDPTAFTRCEEDLHNDGTDYTDSDDYDWDDSDTDTNDELALNIFDHEIDYNTADYSLPECQTKEIYPYKPGNVMYKPGTIVKVHDIMRFMCRHSELCQSADHAPDTMEGASVWRILTIEEAWDLSMDNYDDKKKYNPGEEVVAGQWNWICDVMTFCEGINPLSDKGRETWRFNKVKPSEKDCSEEATTETDTTAEPTGGIYDPFTDYSVDDEFKIPPCIEYILYKFNENKIYKVGDIVYFKGKRRACVHNESCSKEAINNNDERVWKSLKTGEAVNLSQDNYVSRGEYTSNDKVIFLGSTYTCQHKEWCSEPKFVPLTDDGNVWTRVTGEDIAAENCKSFDGDASTLIDGYENKSICRSYSLETFKRGNNAYRPGYLVVHNGQIYRCTNEEICKYEEVAPGEESDERYVWHFVDSFTMTDLTQESYIEGKAYNEGDSVVYHQIKFICVDNSGNCGKREFDPYSEDGYLYWGYEGEVPSSLECENGNVMSEGKVIRVEPTTGAPKINQGPGGTTDGGSTTDLFKDRLNHHFEVDNGVVTFIDDRITKIVNDIRFDMIPNDVDNNDWMERENVSILKQVLNAEKWNTLFPNRKTFFSLQSFEKAVSQFPNICEKIPDDSEKSLILCKKELTVIFVYIMMSSHPDLHKDSAETDMIDEIIKNGLTNIVDQTCVDNKEECDTYIDWTNPFFSAKDIDPMPYYFNRGIGDFAGNLKYGFMSQMLLNDRDTLLDNPDQVLEDPTLMLSILLMNYYVSFKEGPSMHAIARGKWRPNNGDLMTGNLPSVGSIMNTIAPQNCGEYTAVSLYFMTVVKTVIDMMESSFSPNEMVGCEKMKEFNPNGAGFVPKFWNGYVDHEGTPGCHLVMEITPWFIGKQNSYSDCLADIQQQIDNGDIDVDPVPENLDDIYEINQSDYFDHTPGSPPVITHPKLLAYMTSSRFNGPANSDVKPPADQARILEGGVTIQPISEGEERIRRVLNMEVFQTLFPKRKPFCSYNDVVFALKAWPAFCNEFHFNEDGLPEDVISKLQDEICAKEIATLFAHIVGDAKKQRMNSMEGQTTITRDASDSALSDHYVKPCDTCPFEEFWGDNIAFVKEPIPLNPRGTGMLSNYDEYAFFSRLTKGNKYNYLLRPNQISENCEISMQTAVAKYMSLQSHYPAAPTPHEIVVGSWKPNTIDEMADISAGFGATINSVAPEECGEWRSNENATTRISAYKRNMTILKIEHLNHGQLECTQMYHFRDGGSGFIPRYWAALDFVDGKWTCGLSHWYSEWSIILKDSYEGCVAQANGDEFEQLPQGYEEFSHDNAHHEEIEYIKHPFYIHNYDPTTWGEYSVPECMDYLLDKYEEMKDYAFSRIVYYNERRYMCMIPQGCPADNSNMPGENEIIWRDMKDFEAFTKTSNFPSEIPC